MKTVTNKTHSAIKVPLPRGKALHLGPRKTGQIRDADASHPAVKKLIEAGTIEIFEGGQNALGMGGQTTAPHEATHGFGAPGVRQNKGDR